MGDAGDCSNGGLDDVGYYLLTNTVLCWAPLHYARRPHYL